MSSLLLAGVVLCEMRTIPARNFITVSYELPRNEASETWDLQITVLVVGLFHPYMKQKVWLGSHYQVNREEENAFGYCANERIRVETRPIV